MANRWGNNGNSDRLYFLGLQNHSDGDCSCEIKTHLLLGRKAMTNLDSILKSRDITLLTKICLVKAMVFPVVLYRWMWEMDHKEGWTLKNCTEFAGEFFTNWAIREAHDKPRQNIKKQRHYFANKGPSSQSYGFSSSHVWIWELDYKENWTIKKAEC